MKTVLISVAHSSRARGAANSGGLPVEYEVSKRASMACYRSLAGEVAVELFDCGPLPADKYDDAKVARVNTCRPDLAVEIHCNAGSLRATYSETIYANEHSPAKRPAQLIAEALQEGFLKAGFGWPSRGARADDRGLFFLQRTIVPAVIVEGLFISNDEQADWLVNATDDGSGQDLYGLFVADGIKKWLRS